MLRSHAAPPPQVPVCVAGVQRPLRVCLGEPGCGAVLPDLCGPLSCWPDQHHVSGTPLGLSEPTLHRGHGSQDPGSRQEVARTRPWLPEWAPWPLTPLPRASAPLRQLSAALHRARAGPGAACGTGTLSPATAASGLAVKDDAGRAGSRWTHTLMAQTCGHVTSRQIQRKPGPPCPSTRAHLLCLPLASRQVERLWWGPGGTQLGCQEAACGGHCPPAQLSRPVVCVLHLRAQAVAGALPWPQP